MGTATTNSFNVTGLASSTTYSMTVKAKDAAGNTSAASTALSVKTTADTTAPSAPTGLAASVVATTSFTLKWTVSTDNVGVASYVIFKNGTQVGTATTTSSNLTGLSAGTAYSMTVKAKDAVNNLSSASTALSVTTSAAAASVHGTQNVTLAAQSPASEVDHEFGSFPPDATTVYADLFAKPVAGADYITATLLDVDAARVAFIKTGSTGQFAAFDGDGLGSGTWKNLGPTVAIDTSAAAAAWQRVTARLNYTTKTWDLYINGAMVAPDLKFRLNTAAYFSWLSLKGHTAAAVQLDDVYVGAGNPLFTDTNNNGIDDAWETAHAMSLASDNRSPDADNDGLTNIQEYALGTDPNKADTDGDGLKDSAEISMGRNPLVPESDSFLYGLANLKLYLKAGAGLVGSPIFQWLDQSGLGNHATQTNPDNQPSAIPNALNGYPAVHLDTSDYFYLPNAASLLSGASEGEVFVVWKTNDTGTSHGHWSLGSAPPGAYERYEDAIDEDFGSTRLYSLGTPLQPINQYHLYNVSSKTNDWVARFNGLVHYRSTFNTPGFRSNVYLGRNQDPWTFNGDIAEAIIFDRVLSAQEREAVGKYLTTKYALPGVAIPSAPTNLTAVATAPTLAVLAWTPPGGTAGKIYTVERQTGSGSFSALADVYDNLAYRDTTVAAGQAYTYRVKARTYAGQSGYSNTVPVTTPSAGADIPTANRKLWLLASNGVLRGVSGVFQWLDQSGLGNNAEEWTVDSQPQLVSNALNGEPVVRFDANDFFRLPDTPDFVNGITAAEIFVVWKSNATAGPRAPWGLGSPTPGVPTNYQGTIDEAFGSTAVHNTGAPL